MVHSVYAFRPNLTARRRRRLASLGMTLIAASLSILNADKLDAGDHWPAFLGSGASLAKTEKIPLRWSPTEKIAWASEIPGHGQSSPVVWDGLIFVSSVVGPKKESNQILCYRLSDGSLAWKSETASSFPVENSVYVSRAAPTPVVDQDRVVVFFESGDVVALGHDGKEQWKRSISQEYGEFANKFGLSGSLVQTQDSVYILVDDEGPSYLLAIDKKTGKNRWKQDRTSRTSWSSPSIVSIGGKPQIVVSSAGSIDGYDADSGNPLWTFTDVGGNTGTTPIDMGEGRFLVAASAGQDGKNTERAKKSNFMMQVKPTGSTWSASPIWFSTEATPSWASPITYKNCAYWINRTGVVFCYDAQSGKLHYKERVKQSSWATPIGIGDRVYFFGKDGLTTVIKAGPVFEVLAENELWDPNAIKPDENAGAKEPTEERRRAAAMFSGPTVYGVAIADNSLVLRIGEKLFCVREKE